MVVDGGDVRLGRYMDDRFGLVVCACGFSLRERERDAFPYNTVYNVRVINPEFLTMLGIRIRRIRIFWVSRIRMN